jgi:hypothetical protein
MPFDFHLLFQVIAFQEIISALRLVVSKGVRPPWSKLLNITVGIRHNTLDYSDKFQWDVLSKSGDFIMHKRVISFRRFDLIIQLSPFDPIHLFIYFYVFY